MASVLEGKDGYLFLSNDTNKVVQQTTGRRRPSLLRLALIAGAHRRRMMAAARIGAAYRHVVVPNKETVLAHLLPAGYEIRSAGPTPLDRYRSGGFDRWYRAFFFDPEHLTGSSHDQAVFPRQESHWTHLGAYLYLKRALAMIGTAEEAVAIGRLEVVRHDGFNAGDLGSMGGLQPERIPLVSVPGSAAQLRVSNGLHNNGLVRHYANPKAMLDARVLVLHDSTINWLVDVIAALYRDVLLVHCPDLDPGFVKAFRPSVIWFFQIERFFFRIPSNRIDIVRFVAGMEGEKGSERSAVPFLREWRTAGDGPTPGATSSRSPS